MASNKEKFEEIVMPHLDAAFNLARWLTGNDQDAEDVVQEAYLRAYKFFNSFRGIDGRCWLLTIVRNTCYSWLQQNRPRDLVINSDEELETLESRELNPEARLIQYIDGALLEQALEELPWEFREVIILRELEEMSYKEIAHITNIPLGTVMSRLARARKQLQQYLVCHASGDN